MNFPYRNIFYFDTDKIKLFNNLKKYNLQFLLNKTIIPKVKINIPYTFLTIKGEYKFLIYNTNDYFNVLVLSDLFNDECRVKCSFANNISPYDYFYANEFKLLTKLKKNNIELTPHNIRETIYNHTIECSNHNPGIIKWFINHFKSKRILDMSSGWGDRLLGAMSCNIDLYYGVDPNSCLHPNYKKIIDLLSKYSPNKNAKFIINEDKFETHEIKETDFDLFYSSPPYFNYEKYTNQKTQSINNFKEKNDWIENFLQPSINKIINHIKNKGYIVFYFTQEKENMYMEKFFDYMKTLQNIYYLGCIFYCNEKFKGQHPIFIFKKSITIPKILYNPKPIIKTITFKDKNLNIIRDDMLIGGTKLRASIPYLKHIIKSTTNELVYLDATNDYAQLCFAYSLYLLKMHHIKLILIGQKTNLKQVEQLQLLTKFYHKNTEYIIESDNIKNLYELADNYKNKKNTIVIPFKLDNDFFEETLFKQLQKHINVFNNIKNIWLVVDSSVILRCYQKLLPNTHFNCIQVGRYIKDTDIYDTNRCTLYKSSYRFFEDFNNIPHNINIIKSYDGKIYEFIDKIHDNDYILHVTGLQHNIFN
jgi:hypothetical protein